MENRRVDLWERDEEFQRSEAGPGYRRACAAGTCRHPAARPPTVTGVESATMGFDHSYPYVLTEAAAARGRVRVRRA